MDMDGSMSVGRRPADRECVGGRRSVSLPSRYIEELENCSSPGVVSKKAAYFEEVIRSASSEKCPPSTNRKTGLRSMDRVDEAVVTDHADVTARTLDFYSDSELDFESKEIEEDLASELGASDGIPENAIHLEQDDSSCVDNESSVSEPLGENLKLDETGLVDDGLCHVEVEKASEGGDNLHILGPLETQTEALKENKDPHHDEKGHDDSALPQANSLEAKRNPGSSASMSKVPVTQKGKLPTRASVTRLEKNKGGEETLRCGAEGIISKRGVPRSIHPVSRSTNFTVPQPFALATDKRKSFGGRLISEDTKTNLTSSASSADRSSTRKPQVGTKTASKQSLKDLRSNVKSEGQAHKESTSPTSVSANGVPRGANGFHLKSDERAEKRKEFYTKLEERVSAREHERNQMKAKTQEETEAELRKLRESLRFKAKPLPSFYHEMPQSKNDLKKAPTTRAISPRLGRPKCNLTEGSHIRLCQQHTPSDPPRAGAVSIKKNSSEKASSLSSSSEAGPKRGKLPAKESISRTSIQKHGSPSPVNVAKENVSEVTGVGVPSQDCSMLVLKEEHLVNGNDPEVGLSSEDCFDLKEEDDLLTGYGADIGRSTDEVSR